MADPPPTIEQEIAEIDSILNGGVTSVAAGDQHMSYNLEHLRQRRNYLIRLRNGKRRSCVTLLTYGDD